MSDGERFQLRAVTVSKADDAYALGQWLLFCIRPVDRLTNRELLQDHTTVQEFIELIKVPGALRTTPEDALNKMIEFFEKYKGKEFRFKP